MNIIKTASFMLAVSTIAVWIGGCATPERRAHPVASQQAGHRMQCRMCYDMAVRVSTGPPKHRRYKVVQRHECPDCRANVVIYSQEGEMKIKCARCAPEGVPCDRCVPPDDTVGSAGTSSVPSRARLDMKRHYLAYGSRPLNLRAKNLFVPCIQQIVDRSLVAA